jgi:hypothetical protein
MATGLGYVLFQGPGHERKVAVERPLGPLRMTVLAGSLKELKHTRIVQLDAGQKSLRVLLFDRSEGMDQG